MGSGKEILKDIISKKVPNYSVSLSSVIKTMGKRKEFSRTDLQDLGDELRKKYGNHILAKLAIEYLQRNRPLIIVDGIRNLGEAEYLRKTFGENFKLIAIDAPAQIRFERISARKRSGDPETFEQFLEMEKRDRGEEQPSYGQQVQKCMDIADFKIDNSGTIAELEKRIDGILSEIFAEATTAKS